jgi:hypothetical protein
MTQAIFWKTLFTGLYWIVGQEQIYFFLGVGIVGALISAIISKYLT